MKKSKTTMAVLSVLLFLATIIQAQTPAFTYQGRLTDTGTPQSIYQMRFELYDALTGGNQVGATITNSSVTVTQGVFTVQLDFGAAAFDGTDRFLEIAVRRNAGDPFIILIPRQQIASSPYATRALNAAQADAALDSNKLGGVDASEYVTTTSVGNSFIKNNTMIQTGNFNISGNGIIGGNVGIGTATPTSKLQVVQSNGYGITQTDGTVTVGSFINSSGGWLGTKSNHPLNFFTNDSQPQMTLSTTGNFGIGTANPANKLDVVGQVNMTQGNGGSMLFHTPNGETGMSILAGTGRADMRFDGDELKLVAGPVGAPPSAQSGLVINTDGRVGIGLNPDRDYKLQVQNGNAGGLEVNIATASTSGVFAISGRNSGGGIGVYGSGGSYAVLSDGFLGVSTLGTGGNTALCRNFVQQLATCSSSLRYKKDFQPFGEGLSFINQLRPIAFKWKADNLPDIGFGAEDVEKINPLFVTYNSKGEVEGVKYDRLSVVFVNAFKEQQTQIERQQKQLEQQQTQIDHLKKLLCLDHSNADICSEIKHQVGVGMTITSP